MTAQQTPARSLLTWLVLAAAVAVLAWQLRSADLHRLLPPQDFCEYWAAGRLNATGGNPYAPEQLLELQRQPDVGWTKDNAVLMYNPPWTLPFVMPVGLLPFGPARLVWLLLGLLIVVGSADMVWRFYGGDPQQRWCAWLAAVAFMPTVVVLNMGQIPPLALLGLVGFLYWQRRDRDLAAGACLMLTLIKPQLVYLLGVAVLLWVVDQRRWRVVLGGGLALVLATVIPWLVNPAVIGQWRQLLHEHPPGDWVTTTFGSLLRTCFGEERRWLQYVAPTIGIAWLAWYWPRHRQTWDWADQLPLLLLVSIITTFFTWMGDMVVLLPAVVQAAVWVARSERPKFMAAATLLYLLANAVILVILSFMPDNQLIHLWVAPALLVGYLFIRQATRVSAQVKENS
jgi:hypothetical protein